jgi:FkbM family methyltransferase
MLWKKKPAVPASPNEIGALFAAQARLFRPDARLTVIDAGVQDGHTARQYLDAFANCRVIGLEPDDANFATASAALAPYGPRMELIKSALSASTGSATLQVNAHSGTHSLLEIGDTRHWEGEAATVKRQEIATVSLDDLCAQRGVLIVDILKMDIQGHELEALKGAHAMLQRAAISVIALEVAFHEVYRSQPLFWDVATHLAPLGYGFHGLFESHYSSRNPNVLSWADAIFLSPKLMQLG